jgi:hypothetical protein
VRIRGGLILTLFLALAIAVTAALGSPASSTYMGGFAAPETHDAVTLTAKGTTLTAARVMRIPVSCPGDAHRAPVTFPRARIVHSGGFTTRTLWHGQGSSGYRLTLTGQFARHRVTGTLKVTATKGPACSGTSAYSASR